MTLNNEFKPSVLVVDDDKEVLTSFQIWLSGENMAVSTAPNSKEAIEILENMNIDVVLLDFRLGRENGLEVAQILKDVNENLKIIIITGFPAYDSALEAMKSGLFDYLSKGTSNEKILETIRRAIRVGEEEARERGDAPQQEILLKFTVICKHSLIKERLTQFSKNYPRFKLFKTFDSLEQMKARPYLPEIDIAMICATCCIESIDDSFSFFNELYKLVPNIKPVLFNEKFCDADKVQLIKSGIKGFFSIDMNSETLERALTLVKENQMWASRKLVNMALPDGREFLKDQLSGVESYGISAREKEILRAIVLGLKNKEIAEKLFISEVTVKSHLHRIFKKLGVDNRTRAIHLVTEKKLL